MAQTFKSVEVIGVAGTFASGKDTIASQLVQDKGYTHVSTGDMVRKVARAKHGSVERPILAQVATELRYQQGAGALVLEALKTASRPLVISGIRSLGEAKALIEAGGTLLYIDAPIEVRYERVQSRQRDQEVKLSLEEFRANEAKEMYAGPNDEDFNIEGIRQLADVVIDNVEPLEKFIAKTYTALGLAD